MQHHTARQPDNQVYKTVVLIWLTLSFAGLMLAALNWVRLSKSLVAASETIAIRSDLDDILRMLLEAESAQRGYAITGNGQFLDQANENETALPRRFDHLAALTRRDPPVLQRVLELRAQAELCLNNYREVVKARREHGPQSAAQIVAGREGEKAMARIRLEIGQIHSMRSDLVSTEGSASRAQVLRANLTSLVAGILGIGAGLLAFWLSRLTIVYQERERDLVEAKLRAERSDQEKTVFLTNLSHEIRTPMNAILGFSELLEGELREPLHRKYLKSIRSSAGSLLQLINDILDLSKIEAGVMELHPEPTDPREICDFVQTLFAEPAAKKGLKLCCHVAEDLPHALLIDRIRLRQVLVNLVGNAVKFTDHGSIELRIHWEKESSSSHVTLVLEVQDTGVGIPVDKLEAIFKPFVQAGTDREKEKQGTGLGLSIVRRLTELMGGRVTAASVIGQGSAFHLRFPEVPISARLPISDQTADADAEVSFNELRRATFLVVDDNAANCQLVAGMFHHSHHRLVFGSNGEEAVNQAREIKPDIILMDVRMPRMDGRSALEAIRKIAGLELTPVIAVTASSLVNEEDGLRAAFSGYIRKPFTKRGLFQELAQFLPRHVPDAGILDSAGGSESGGIGEAEGGSVHDELIAQLRRLVVREWPAIRDTVAINETKAFARRLEALAAKWKCPPLASYARTLLAHAEEYSVSELENELPDFGPLVEKLARKGNYDC